ncbi:MAG: hypothetical protein COA96_04085 [SAR86 cluster bacterium]|uniref:DUF4760 domain-containing protein n=1 Tax=SAR86 cluster bacterium TaxID=2030880 RepID=A0A2A5B6H9_9GAMM|nr:MAG: hypothetical protein COA96_04085 [SAR86 cluster bacterium]
MKLSNLSNWITVGANVGVLIGLAILILELNQNTRIAQTSAYQELVTQIVELNKLEASNPELAEIIYRGHLDASALTPVETRRMINMTRVIYRQGDLGYYQFVTGLISEDRMVSTLGPIRAWLLTDIGKQGWDSMRPNFTGDYIDYVENMMAGMEPDSPFWK